MEGYLISRKRSSSRNVGQCRTRSSTRKTRVCTRYSDKGHYLALEITVINCLELHQQLSLGLLKATENTSKDQTSVSVIRTDNSPDSGLLSFIVWSRFACCFRLGVGNGSLHYLMNQF